MVLRIPLDLSPHELYRVVAQRVWRMLKPQAQAEVDDALSDQKASSAPSGLSRLAPPVPPTDDPDVQWAETSVGGQDAHAGALPPFGFRLREVISDSNSNHRGKYYTMCPLIS